MTKPDETGRPAAGEQAQVQPQREARRPAHLVLLILFLALITGVPAAQAIIDVTLERESKPYILTLFGRAPSEANLRDFEENLERISFLEQRVRPLFQYWRYVALRELGEKALRGAQGWSFYTPGVRYLVEPYFRELSKPPGTDPVAAIADLRRQLAARSIRLLVVPVPGKAGIYPDRLVPGLRPRPEIAAHTARFITELRAAGVEVLALAPAYLAARERRPDARLYMAADTHWTGEGVTLTAATIAAQVRRQAWYRTHRPRVRYTRRAVRLQRMGDIPKMTQIPHQERLFAAERVTAQQVLDPDGEPYEDPDPAAAAPILLLGDSFSRVFQTDEPESAGLIANLAHELQVPLSSIVNDGGASTLVRQELARDPSILAGKRLVIYVFVERDIRLGLKGWPIIDLELGAGGSHRDP